VRQATARVLGRAGAGPQDTVRGTRVIEGLVAALHERSHGRPSCWQAVGQGGWVSHRAPAQCSQRHGQERPQGLAEIVPAPHVFFVGRVQRRAVGRACGCGVEESAAADRGRCRRRRARLDQAPSRARRSPQHCNAAYNSSSTLRTCGIGSRTVFTTTHRPFGSAALRC
jgi:hypothetical protein